MRTPWGRRGSLFGPVSVCVVRQNGYFFAPRCCPNIAVVPFPFRRQWEQFFVTVCFVNGSRISVNFAERLPCTWLTRVMMVATAADPLTPKCSRRKTRSCDALTRHASSSFQLNPTQKSYRTARWTAHHRLETSTSSDAQDSPNAWVIPMFAPAQARPYVMRARRRMCL